MKKIVALGLAAALVGGLAFADPVSNPSVISFNGNATAKWGLDLDALETGFTNETWTEIKLRLFDKGDKVTTGDGIWGELKIKTDANWGVAGDEGWASNGANQAPATASVDAAKIHFGDKVYLGITKGDTILGEYKFQGAIRGGLYNGRNIWLTNVGPADFTQGIVLGYGDDNFGLDVDFRSYKTDATKTNYTSAYAVAAEAKLKDSNSFVKGLAVDAGAAINISEAYSKASADPYDKMAGADDTTGNWFAGSLPATGGSAASAGYAAAKKAYDEAVKTYKDVLAKFEKGEKKWSDVTAAQSDMATKEGLLNAETAPVAAVAPGTKNVHTLGYAANASYKFDIDDKMFVRPAVGMTGTLVSGKYTVAGTDKQFSANAMNLVAGLQFGIGATGADAGVYFLDGDMAKDVTQGVSVIASIPLPSVLTMDDTTTTSYDKIQAIIVPSVYLADDVVKGLRFAAYSEIAILRAKAGDAGTAKAPNTYSVAANENRSFAFAVAGGVKYDLKLNDDAITVTPQVGARFANTAYEENKISSISPLSVNPVFENMGRAQDASKHTDADGNLNKLNLKAGVNVAGLIDNTDIFVEYASANLLNDNVYNTTTDANGFVNGKKYNVQLGTLNIGAKIHF